MPELPTITQARSRLGVATKARDEQAANDARRDLAAAKIAQYVRRVVDEAPPLTSDQLDRLAAILRGGATA